MWRKFSRIVFFPLRLLGQSQKNANYRRQTVLGQNTQNSKLKPYDQCEKHRSMELNKGDAKKNSKKLNSRFPVVTFSS